MKEKKKCLIVCNCFPPMVGAGAKRMRAMANHLSGLGWKVYVLTMDKGYYYFVGKDTDLVSREVAVSRTKVFLPRIALYKNWSPAWILKMAVAALFHYILIPDRFLGWLPFALRRGREIIADESIDVIYSSAPYFTSHIVGYFLKKQSGLPWVAEFRDTWTYSGIFSRKTRLKLCLERILEKKVLRLSDAVISISSVIDEELKKIAGNSNCSKFHVVMNGYEENGSAAVSSLQDSRIFSLTYTGILPSYREKTFRVLLNEVSSLIDEGVIDNKKIKINILGSCPAGLKKFIENIGLSGIMQYQGFVEYSRCLICQQQSSVLLLLTGSTPEYRGEVTAKIFEYLKSNRPIFAVTCKDSLVKHIISRTNTGICADGSDSFSVRKAICSFYHGFYSKPGIEYVPDHDEINKYSYKFLSQKMEAILNEVIAD